VLEEGRLGLEHRRVRATPRLLTAEADKHRPPWAYPHVEAGHSLPADPLPGYGDGCYTATRGLSERAWQRAQAMPVV